MNIRRTTSAARNASSMQNITLKRQATYPPSSHMCLGNGLTKRLKSKHMSCFDFRTMIEDQKEGDARESLSESDIFSLLETSNHENDSDMNMEEQSQPNQPDKSESESSAR